MHKVGAGSRARRVRQLGVRVACVPAISAGLGRHDVAVTRLFLTENVVGIDGIFAWPRGVRGGHIPGETVANRPQP